MEDNTQENAGEQSQDAKKEEIEKRIAAARARTAKANSIREKREADTQLERELVKAEQEAIDIEALAQLEAEHGAEKIGSVETDMGLIILKRPDGLRYKKFQDLENAKSLDVEKLVRPCVVHPDKSRFDLICAELPATLLRCGNTVAELAGTKAKELSGK